MFSDQALCGSKCAETLVQGLKLKHKLQDPRESAIPLAPRVSINAMEIIEPILLGGGLFLLLLLLELL